MTENQNLTPFFRFLQLLYKYKKFFLITNTIVFLSAVLISLILPKWYEGRVVFIINTDVDMAGSVTSAILGNVGLPQGILGSQSLILTDQYINFLGSRYILDKIDSIYKLQEDYDVKYRTVFYKKVIQNTNFVNNGDNTITIKFYYRENPQKAADIANSFYLELNNLVTNLKTENNRKVRIFLENTYQETIRKLNVAEEDFMKFQQSTNIYTLEEQIKLAVNNLYDLESEKIKLEIQKLYFESLGAENSTEYNAVITKIKVINSTIQSIKSKDEYIDIPLEKYPTEGLGYLRLLREIKIREKILEFVIPQLENARLEEQRKISKLQLLDAAVSQDYKAKPKRIVVVFVITFLSLISTILIILIKDFVKNNTNRLS